MTEGLFEGLKSFNAVCAPHSWGMNDAAKAIDDAVNDALKYRRMAKLRDQNRFFYTALEHFVANSDRNCLFSQKNAHDRGSHRTARPNNPTISEVLNVNECQYRRAGTSFRALTNLLIVVALRPQRKQVPDLLNGQFGS
jgi:hypothetical protein